MAITVTRKTLIAMAVAAAAAQAHADMPRPLVLDVAGETRITVEGVGAERIQLTGNAVRNQDGMDFEDFNVIGDFINDANFNLDGDAVDAIGFESNDELVKNSIGGNFVSNGSITATGKGAGGIQITDTVIGSFGSDAGDLNLNGSIIVTDTSGVKADEAQAGLRIEHSTIHGDLRMAAGSVIDVAGNDAYGIYIDGLERMGQLSGKNSKVGRDIILNGSLSVTGTSATALSMDNVGFSRDIENKGTISATGDDSTGIRLYQTDYNKIDNQGTIVATGAGSIGIHIRDSFDSNLLQELESNGTPVVPGVHPKGGIHNTGNITAESVGIQITNNGADTGFGGTSHSLNEYRINHEGGLIKASIAIDGNGQSYLYLRGGDIEGDLDGLRGIFVQGNSTVKAEEIYSTYTQITGKLTLTEATEFKALNGVDALVEVKENGALAIFVSDASDASAPLVQIGGDLVLQKGSQVGVTTTAGSYTKEAQNFTLVSADSILDQGATFKAFNNLLKMSNVVVGATDITADVALNEGADAVNDIGVKGVGRNAAMAFINSVLPNLDTSSELYQTLINASDEQLASMLSTLAPETNGAAASASLAAAGLASNALSNRVAALGANSGEALVETGAWVEVLSGTSDQNQRGGVAGYDSRSKGFVVGADGKINEQTTLGVAFAHVATDVSSDNGNKTDVKNNMLSVYGAWEQGNVDVFGNVAYSVGSNDSKRHTIGEVNKASYDSSVLSMDLSAGYNISLNEELTFTPTVGTRYANISIDSYKEKGGATALNMGSQNIEVFELGAGFKVTGNYGDFKPRASLMAYHDFAQDNGNATSAYQLGGTSFVTTGAPTTKWTYEAGVGVDWTKGNYTIGASYDYTRKADFNADTFSVKARYDF